MCMPHPLVLQLRFARSEFQRALVGLSDEEARRSLPPMTCISWSIGHLASQEQRYWLGRGQGGMPLPQINTPDLNQDAGIWNLLKRVERKNVCCCDLTELATVVRQ